MRELVISTPDSQDLEKGGAGLVARAQVVVITNREQHAKGLNSIKWLKEREKLGHARFEPTRSALDLAKKELLELRDSLIEPYKSARLILEGKCNAYELAEKTRVREEQLRLQAAATTSAQSTAASVASRAQQLGLNAVADHIRSKPTTVPAVKAPEPELARVAGVGSQERWSAAVDDTAALLRWALETGDLAVVSANVVELNARARDQKDKLSIPGVRAVSNTIRPVRS